jgi:hypothetical protein
MNETRRATAFIFFLAATAMCALSLAARGQETLPATGTMTIDAEGPRPLDAAISELVGRHGWAVTYEELPPEYSGDTVDAASSLHMSGKVATRLRVAKWGSLRFSYKAPQPGGQSAAATLSELLGAYRASDPPFQVELARTGDVYHVIARGTRNELGVYQERTPPLDAVISLPEKERTVDETISEIVTAVQTKFEGRFMGPGFFMNLFSRTVVVGAHNETARSVLLRTLRAATPSRVGWEVLCVPPGGPVSAACALNVWVGQPSVPPPNWRDLGRKR